MREVEPYKLEVRCESKAECPVLVLVATVSEMEEYVSSLEKHSSTVMRAFKRNEYIQLFTEQEVIAIRLDGTSPLGHPTLCRLASLIANLCKTNQFSSCDLQVSGCVEEGDLCQLMKCLYVSNHHTSFKSSPMNHLTCVNLPHNPLPNGVFSSLREGECQVFARNLGSLRANMASPQNMRAYCQAVYQGLKELTKHPLDMTVISGQDLQDQGLNLLYNVGKGNCSDPVLVDMFYQGDPNSQQVYSLVGKGITFDSGGLDLKSTRYMKGMFMDKCGGCSVLAVFRYAVQMGLKLNLSVTVGWAENSPSGSSYRPGDILQSLNGLTVEIGNTDAEGRLTLADSMVFAQKKHRSTVILEMSTLTGSMIHTLGKDHCGVYSNCRRLCDQLVGASVEVGEQVVPQHIYQENIDNVKNCLADVTNSCSARHMGAANAAAFLTQFVDDQVKFAHLDVAGYATDGASQYATGNVVQTMLRYLVHRQ